MRLAQAQRGTTMVDLLTAMLFTGILTLITGSWAQSVLRDSRRQQAAAEAQAALTLALEVIAVETRGAGFHAGGDGMVGLAAATADRIEVHSDLDGDGAVASSHERIVFSYRSATRQLGRATGQGGAQLLADDIPPGGFVVRYFDASGNQLSAPAAGLTESDRQRVRRIDVSLRTERSDRSGGNLAATATTSIRLRNSTL
ncbi:MAG TPA: hypothetical protein VEB21_04400 [Terriglobales bacterium]|nr:hypothetical protein [Terriglobales bacterium]